MKFFKRLSSAVLLDHEGKNVQKLKEHLKQTTIADQVPKTKRKLFQVKAHTPWYSFDRSRNIVILACFLSLWMFSSPLKIVWRSMKYSFMLEVERYKFQKQLDEE